MPCLTQQSADWTLLSSELRFLVLDPVLAFHLQEQSSQIISTSLLDFVHPEEQASAREDLGGVINDRTLHGSVTRCAPLSMQHRSFSHSVCCAAFDTVDYREFAVCLDMTRRHLPLFIRPPSLPSES